MAYDSRIILGAQQFDLAGAMNAGRDMAMQQKAFDQQNALAELFKTQGANIMAGDQNALAQLAQYDPAGAQSMAYAAEDQQRQRETARREGERYAKEVGAEKAAAEAADVEAKARYAMSAPDPATFDARAIEIGRPDLVGQFDDREMLALPYLAWAEGVKLVNPAPVAPADEYGRYVAEETAAGRPPLSRIDFEQAIKGNGVTQTIRNPDGTETTIQIGGAPGANPGGRTGKPTEGSLASEGYLQRMQKAEGVFKTLEEAGTTALGWTDRPAVNTDAESWKLTEPEQMLLQAQRDWVRAKLRKESGAVIGPDEMAAEIRQYFPQPGEGPRVIEQKKASRAAAEEQLRITALLPPAAAAVDDGTGIGTIEDGFRYIGGDASTPEAWEPVQ